MKLYNSLKLYKKNINLNKLIIIYALIFTTLYMIFQDFKIIEFTKVNNVKFTDFKQFSLHAGSTETIVYILIFTIIMFKLLDFIDNSLYIIKIGSKSKLWNLIMKHIVITSCIMSFHKVFVGYLFSNMMSDHMYTDIGKTILILIITYIFTTLAGVLIGISIYILKVIIKNNGFTLFIVIGLLLLDSYTITQIISGLYWRSIYTKPDLALGANMIIYVGVAILLFELGRVLNKRFEVYSTKSKFGDGNEYEY